MMIQSKMEAVMLRLTVSIPNKVHTSFVGRTMSLTETPPPYKFYSFDCDVWTYDMTATGKYNIFYEVSKELSIKWEKGRKAIRTLTAAKSTITYMYR